MYRYSPSRILLFLEAFILLACARASLLCMSFRHTARWFGLQLIPTIPQDGRTDVRTVDDENQSAGPESEAQAQISAAGSSEAKVTWAIRAASRRTPWESKCLAQALAGSVMLRRRRIGGLVYLGLYRADETADAMFAHAWLRTGNAILTGAAGHEKYTVVARFRVLPVAVSNFTTNHDDERNTA